MRTFLPSVHGNADIAAQGQPCGMNERASEFAAAWLELLGNGAARMVCDARLVTAAQDHAEFLAQREDTSPSMHIGKDGSTANERVRAVGYALPDFWPEVGNQVESCTRSWETPATAAVSLAAHDTHREHMLGLNWYSEHVIYGVGSATEYFVCVTCPKEE